MDGKYIMKLEKSGHVIKMQIKQIKDIQLNQIVIIMVM